MKLYQFVIPILALMPFISSCEFSCKVGAIDEKEQEAKATGPVKIGNALVYNNIQVNSKKLSLNKAYLIFESGERVPYDNIVDFTSPIELILHIDSGWAVNNGKVMIGGSEKVTTESGQVVLDEADLFDSTGIVSEEDARFISLKVFVKANRNSPPTSFRVNFRVWDKNSDAFIEGNYRLYYK